MKGFSSLFSLASLLAVVTASSVLDLTPDNFDQEVLKSGKPALVEFFAVGSLVFLREVSQENPDADIFSSLGVDVSLPDLQ
jgi:hypothetical protein